MRKVIKNRLTINNARQLNLLNLRIALVLALGLIALVIPARAQDGKDTKVADETKGTVKPASTRAAGFTAEVIHVEDGDTIKIRRPGQHQIETLHLIGIDAPEVSTRDHAGQEPYGTRAQQYLSIAITRKIVRIEQDVQPSNEMGDLLGYVWLGDKLMNEEMLKSGFVFLATKPPNIKYTDRFQQAQTAARDAKSGIWDEKSPLAESASDFRKENREAAIKLNEAEAALELPEYQDGCIVGNRKTKKYHLPSGHFYKQAKESKNHIFFRTSADAEKAGYTRAAK